MEKQRALQTAEIFSRYLTPVEGVEEGEGLKPLDDVTSWAVKLAPGADLMLVGHLPFMEKLTGFLTTGSEEITPFKFQNSGIICLDRHSDSDKWIHSVVTDAQYWIDRTYRQRFRRFQALICRLEFFMIIPMWIIPKKT